MIIVTGAAGFIGSCMVAHLNHLGYYDLVVVDDYSREDKNKNLEGKRFSQKIHRDKFVNWLGSNHKLVQFVIHLGARTDTAEFDMNLLNSLNLEYSKDVWKKCVEFGLPLIYASSAATYGEGEMGYSDAHDVCEKLTPLNPYGISKNEFDKWALGQKRKPYFWIGLKFFNVFGPNEYHKGRMASVVFHAYNQISEKGQMKLFKSHKPEYQDGEQLRDFVYVKDVVKVMEFFMLNRKEENSGIYNLGTGKARTFNDLASSTFKCLSLENRIEYIDTPIDIRDKYQYYTQAEMTKLYKAGYDKEFTSLEDAVEDYVTNYLDKQKAYF